MQMFTEMFVSSTRSNHASEIASQAYVSKITHNRISDVWDGIGNRPSQERQCWQKNDPILQQYRQQARGELHLKVV